MLKNILNRQLTGRTNPVFYGNFPPNILYAPELNTTHMDEIQHILNRGEVDNAYLYWYNWVENSPDEPPTRAAQDEAFQKIEQAMAAPACIYSIRATSRPEPPRGETRDTTTRRHDDKPAWGLMPGPSDTFVA